MAQLDTGRDLGLGYLGLTVSDLAAWHGFGREILGAEVRPALESGAAGLVADCQLRLDDRSHRILLHEGDDDDLAYVGWEVPTPAALERLTDRLNAAGHDVVEEPAEVAAARDVTTLLSVADPDGLRTELFTGPYVDRERPFHPSRSHPGYVMGELGLGHIVLAVNDIDRTRAFYEGPMGFRLSDQADFPMPDGVVRTVSFFHCNPRHHSLALVPIEWDQRLRHIMLEVQDLDEVGRCLDLARDRDIVSRRLGRHTNDRMVSFYLHSPSGFEVEYGWGARTVDDNTWRVERHRGRASVWGHQRREVR